MRLGLGLAGLAVAGLWSAVAVAADDKNEAVILEPRTPWNVDFGEQRCRLARVFDDGEDRHLLIMDQYGPSARFQFSVSGPAFERFRRTTGISVQFGELQREERMLPYLDETESIGPSLNYASLALDGHSEDDAADQRSKNKGPPAFSQIDPGIASQIETVTVRQGKKVVRFATGSLGDPVGVLNQCTRNIVKNWGFDPDQQAAMTRAPEWLESKNFVRFMAGIRPSRAKKSGEQTIFRIRLSVEENGLISECFINNSTLAESLKSPMCIEISRSKFEPALDRNGNPMRSFFLTTISNRIH